MKNTFLSVNAFCCLMLLALTTFGQNKAADYEKMWKEVEKNLNDNLPLSAAKILDNIELQAIDEGNKIQQLKTVLYRGRVFSMTEDNDSQVFMQYLKSQLPNFDGAYKTFLNIALAKSLDNYQANHSYQIGSNQHIEGSYQDVELKFWDRQAFEAEINLQIEAALSAEDILKSTSTKDFEVLFENEKIDFDLEPTLYDYAVHSVLMMYRNETTQEKRNRSWNTDSWWLPADAFCTLDFHNDQDNLILKSLKLYAELLKFNAQSKFEKAYLYNDLRRLDFVSQNTNGENIDKYIEALEALRKKNAKKDVSAEIASIEAQKVCLQYENDHEDSLYAKNYTKALGICEEAISAFPKSKGGKSCQEIKDFILNQEVAFTIQDVVLSESTIPVAINYRNAFNPTYRIVKLSASEIYEAKSDNDAFKKKIYQRLPVAENKLELPHESDYLTHSALVALPKLPYGMYALLFSTNGKFSGPNDNKAIYELFQVSDMCLVTDNQGDEKLFYVLDRKSGKPISGVKAEMFFYAYDYKARKRKLSILDSEISGKDGAFLVKLPKSQFYVNLYRGADTLMSSDVFYHPAKYESNFIERTNFYTDRAIYRPGQTVHFKGIILKSKSDEKQIVANKQTVVVFRDANYQEIASLTLTSNEYGSFDGSFVIPTDLLNGEFQISNENGRCFFKVEEYKRPTFNITFNAPKEKYKLNENVTLDGSVDALAGFGLDNVKYTYRVVRQTNFPFRYWYLPYPIIEDEQISFGDGITDEQGKFSITFNLQPSTEAIAEQQPVFNYIIYVDATNAQGEVQSKSYSIRAAYNEVTISTNIAESVKKSDLAAQHITVTNSSGEPAETKVIRRFYRLVDPKQYARKLGDMKFDRKLYDDETLKKLFPEFDYYAGQDILSQKELIYEDKIDVKDQAELFPVNANKFDNGRYYVELSSADDSLAKYAATFVLFDSETAKMPYKDLCWHHLDKNSAQPGDKVHFLIGSSEKDVNVWMRVKNGDRILVDKWVKIDKGVFDLSYDVKEADRGLLSFQAVFVRHNSSFLIAETVQVPYDNLKLDVELSSVRDVMLPGSEEQWKVIVRDNTKSPVVANLLASMYDASLDQFSSHNWLFDVAPVFKYAAQIKNDNSFGTSYRSVNSYFPYGLDFSLYYVTKPSDVDCISLDEGVMYYRMNSAPMSSPKSMGGNVIQEESAMMVTDAATAESELEDVSSTPKIEPIEEPVLTIRENFNETAFFYPQLETAEDGSVTFAFTMPDALTRWNLMLLAYTKDLKAGQNRYAFTTSKPLMIMADMPRFCYEEDTLWLVANVVNTGGESCFPKAKLEIFDAQTMEPLNLVLSEQTVDLGEIQAARSKAVRWKVGFVKDISLLTFRFTATSNGFSDAEQHLLPVFSNEIFMVESMPMTVKGHSKKNFSLDMLNPENNSERNYSFTLNFSTNPVWYAVQALPYLAEANDQYVETAFYRFYANTLAAHVAKNIPNFSNYIQKWKIETPGALQSQLEKDQDLKAILLQETPWVMEAKNETEQKARLANLLDVNALSYQQSKTLSLLRKKQKNNGGWPWIDGMPESRFVTSYILSGLGKLSNMNAVAALSNENQNITQNIATNAVNFLRQELTNEYSQLKDAKMKENYVISHSVLDALYAMSYFPQIKSRDEYQSIESFYLKKLTKDWKDLGFEYQAKAALVLFRKGNKTASALIMQSLKERARQKDDIGMYWSTSGYFLNSSVAVQANIMEAFDEVVGDADLMNQMRLWLLTQKQTNQWESNKASAEAIYALLMRGEDWLHDTDSVTIRVGKELIDTKGDAGTGYFQRRWNAAEITSDMDGVFVENPTNHLVWGGLFRQYFVPIDEVKSATSPLKIKRELFVERNGDQGTYLVPIKGQSLKIGDKITVQLTIESTQDMEYVFVKDLRAACLEPIDQVSGYHYNGGIGYYRSITDGFVGFHMDFIPKGTHKISHSMFVSKEGEFSNGYALIQCLYAPEFSSYSDGMRMTVGER